MRKILSLFLIIFVLLTLCACAQVSIDENDEVSLCFVSCDEDIHATLTDEEAASIIQILGGRLYDPIWAGVPACGFDENISIKVGSRSYAVACDTCSYLQDLDNLRFFSVSEEDMAYIHALFEKYGGHFPCV